MENSFIFNNKLKLSNNVVNKSKLITQYYTLFPDPGSNSEHSIFFGTSGHRGSAQKYTFNEAHILAISQSIVQMRAQYGITGPCYIGKDTHILSEPAFISVLEVLTANFVDVIIQKNNEYTPTPAISHAIVSYNKKKYYSKYNSKADGIIVTSSHNPPEDGGIKYSSIFGGPASISITQKITKIANKLLMNNLKQVHRITLNQAWNSGYIHIQDFTQNYVKKLSQIINMKVIKESNLKLGVDPLSGSSINYWQNIAQYYQLNLTIIDEKIDQTFSFIKLNHNNHIRIDCISELALTRSIQSSKNFDLFFVNDPDCDRHGIITSDGLIQSHYYFSIAINYLFHHRPLWNQNNYVLSIGKTNVSSTIINNIAYQLKLQLFEFPVGFKWFVKGLFNSYLSFAGEESAGASFLDYNYAPWSTDKDGLIMCLLAAEIVAVTDKTLLKNYDQLKKNFGLYNYNQTYITINHVQKSCIFNTLFSQIHMTELAGDPIIKVKNIKLSNKKISMDGIKIITRNGWIACRLSGTELAYKIYCESFLSIDHRQKMEQEVISKINRIIN